MKKYHSLAAKGEQVDVSEIAKNKHADADAEFEVNNQQPSQSNGVGGRSPMSDRTTLWMILLAYR